MEFAWLFLSTKNNNQNVTHKQLRQRKNPRKRAKSAMQLFSIVAASKTKRTAEWQLLRLFDVWTCKEQKGLRGIQNRIFLGLARTINRQIGPCFSLNRYPFVFFYLSKPIVGATELPLCVSPTEKAVKISSHAFVSTKFDSFPVWKLIN